MARTVALEWGSYMKGQVVDKNPAQTNVVGLMMLSALPGDAVATVAGQGDSFGAAWMKILQIGDWIAVGVFAFAGFVMMFGNRTKFMEMILGGAVGYMVVRHAVDIRDWLKTI